ncbi:MULTISPECIES: DUF5309 domain-containing protein [Lysinibacillus]|uniref:DUF5309 domain-containing protein n=1 Tax=Lysinibacillus TaxID=400634 RepID=UPI0021A58797|nr:DUF5309 domain-containing protein [Lysinibacillus capsici]MCT1538431.1 DUF5309 domain-containing protein [Lysinibacillus capsici]MCT1569139.1 DUF5309 domain-containing protein [Lysinibacillus capsici]MCT1646154.1 DUF5309 domain-containing protein [Lysinibacillus capsici]MCT1725340.1 DUF5309 domain-containing protein [Lysinibacillus capsici]MCT1784120.1 DUF5309 domain-containing protein [Lysinibacillus capsici]
MITSQNGFTATESISLSKELALLGVQDCPLSSLLLSKGVEKALSTVYTWKEKTFATDGETDAVEGADTVTFQQSDKRELSNILQIFKRAVSVSGSAEAMQSTKFNEEIADRLLELKMKLESVLINGLKKDGSKTPFIRNMSGLIEMADNTNAKSNSDVEALIKDGMRTLWNNKLTGGTYYAFVNADVKETIDGIYKDKYSYQHKETNFGLLVETINTNYGVVNVVLSRDIPANKIVLFNDSYVNMAALRPVTFTPLAKTGDSTKGHVVGEYTLKVGSPKAVAVLTVTE